MTNNFNQVIKNCLIDIYKVQKLIPFVNNYWYSPDGPGGKSAIKRLNENCMIQKLN